jgi:PadR family transcriptional regulator, regulatory protein PadR
MSTSPRVRLTTTTVRVLDMLMSADPDEPPWGYRICEETGLGSGTVYPILERLEKAEWIAGRWETSQPEDRPSRRFYTITERGAREYAAAVAAKRSRHRWVPLPIHPRGGTA